MRNTLWMPTFAAAVLLVSGCSAASIDATRKAADTAATFVIADTCVMTLGAYHRLGNPNHKLGADLICDPNAQAPITVEDVLRLLEAR